MTGRYTEYYNNYQKEYRRRTNCTINCEKCGAVIKKTSRFAHFRTKKCINGRAENAPVEAPVDMPVATIDQLGGGHFIGRLLQRTMIAAGQIATTAQFMFG